jgi:hypothetical protein
LTFKSNATGAIGVLLNNAERVELIDCNFIGSSSTGVKVTGTCTYNTVSNCFFSNLAQGISVEGAWHYSEVIGCQFGEQLSGTPISWIRSTNAAITDQLKIVGCTFYGTGATVAGIDAAYGSNWIIADNTFSKFAVPAVKLGSNGSCYGFAVSACSFSANSNDDIYVNGAQSNTIIGCTFGTRYSGTTVSTYCNVRILNTFGGTAGYYNSVVSCVSQDTGTALLNSFYSANACQSNLFVGNVYSIAVANAGTGATTIDATVVQAGATKVGFYSAAPVAQQNTTGTTTGFTAATGTAVLSASTFTGGVGATAYTLGDVVKALKAYGLMAQ